MAMHVIRMPDLGEGIAEVELVDWRVAVGDTVAEDQVLADVMTDKATVEIPSPVAGRVISLGGEVGQTLAVGAELIRIELSDEPIAHPPRSPAAPVLAPPLSSAPAAAAPAAAATPRPAPPARTPTPGPTAAIAMPRPIASPAVRARAWELGIDLRELSPSGTAGRVMQADLDAHVARHGAMPPPPAPTPAPPHGEDGRSVGTGVVVVDNGLILTNLHVVAGAQRITVSFADGSESEADLVNLQPENDLAVLRARVVPDDLHAATLRSTADLAPGDEVIAVGFPFGIGPSASQGVVSGLKREFRSPEGERVLANLIQFDAAANPGNSGGPLVTMDGHVVGIVTAILNPSPQRTFIGIGFAVPIESAAAAAGMPPF